MTGPLRLPRRPQRPQRRRRLRRLRRGPLPRRRGRGGGRLGAFQALTAASMTAKRLGHLVLNAARLMK